MPSNPLTWGLGSFQSCTITPVVEAADGSSSAHLENQIFSNGKLLTFGFRVSPSHSSHITTFYNEFKNNFDHIVLSYQLVHERKGLLLSKTVSAKALQNDGCDQLNLRCINDQLFITVSSRFKVSPMHLHKSLTLLMSLEFSFTHSSTQRAHIASMYQVFLSFLSLITLSIHHYFLFLFLYFNESFSIKRHNFVNC